VTGGDLLDLAGTVVLPADAPRTAAFLADAGFPVASIDVSELQKIEAGVTCMSVLLP
jgi:dimethylargininase